MRYVITPALTGELLHDWLVVSERYDDPYVDPRMIAAVQESMANQARFSNVIVYDEDDHPAAISCFFAERADTLLLAPPRVRRVAQAIRRLRQKFFRFPMLFCGLPASAGWNQLRFRHGTDVPAALQAIHRAQEELRRPARAWATVLMEFDDTQAADLHGLEDLGYARADSPPMYVLPAQGRTFEEYVAAMKSHYRRMIPRSERKFAKSGIRVAHLSGGDAFLNAFTDEVYDLYLQVVRRADIVMHVLPAAYFRALAQQFGEQFLATILYQNERPVGFAIGIIAHNSYYGQFIGLDYAGKEASDLYFNLFYENLRFAMQRRVEHVFMGSDSDRFKLRLGCRRSRRHVYIHLHGWPDRPFRRTKRLWLPPIEYVDHEMDVFLAPAASMPTSSAIVPSDGGGAIASPVSPKA
ncbi:MAG TPA: GNAT family N-acetyltransferase [Pirellulales bacterium]|nr:GNAT family N-acetyltransferase [Pirellulales bacterium]